MSEQKKILFIINPISGVGKKNTIPPLIEKYLDKTKFRYEISYTKHRGHGKEIADAEKDRYDAIVAVGGDGSVNEIGSSLVGSNCALAIIPCGSGNGLARHAKIPLKLKNAIERINKFESTQIDVGSVNGKIFLGTCGFGFDALVAKKFDEYHQRGFAGYVKLVIREFKKYKPNTYAFEVDGKTIERTAFMCSVANSSQFGNGFTISPLSVLQDGKSEWIFLEHVKFYRLPLLAGRFFNRTIHHSKHFESFTFDSSLTIRMLNTNPAYLHVDGEPAGAADTFQIVIHPLGLNLI
ncbi:MAG: diacylglycerol kinase family lipid kinase [Crocinitomicaceae bacterium]|nr:diacylglycerol kinase family lipid kinase [Crocinitomicaceae bacterium]